MMDSLRDSKRESFGGEPLEAACVAADVMVVPAYDVQTIQAHAVEMAPHAGLPGPSGHAFGATTATLEPLQAVYPEKPFVV